jgi:hypothetical protein
VDADTVTQERVLPANLPLVDLHPQFVKKMGPYVVWSIDEPSVDERRCAFRTGVMILVEITEPSPSELFPGVNTAAAEYASKHALEWWPDISEPARTKIRQIIKNAFEEKTPFSEVISHIQDAGTFSEARATMIAETEISQAQVGANFEVWKQSGMVKEVKWLAVGLGPCPVCKANDGQVRSLGEPFPSGDIYPMAHPCCQCILQAVEFKE